MAFAAPPAPDTDLGWTPISARLATARRLVAGSVGGAVLAGWLGFLALQGAGEKLIALVGLVGVLSLLATLWLIGRQVRALGYCEGESEFHLRRGRLRQQVITIPSHRLQYVVVRLGPVEQLFGLASVTVFTATPLAAATLPGLTLAQAEDLRDRLAAANKAEASSL